MSESREKVTVEGLIGRPVVDRGDYVKNDALARGYKKLADANVRKGERWKGLLGKSSAYSQRALEHLGEKPTEQ